MNFNLYYTVRVIFESRKKKIFFIKRNMYIREGRKYGSKQNRFSRILQQAILVTLLHILPLLSIPHFRYTRTKISFPSLSNNLYFTLNYDIRSLLLAYVFKSFSPSRSLYYLNFVITFCVFYRVLPCSLFVLILINK